VRIGSAADETGTTAAAASSSLRMPRVHCGSELVRALPALWRQPKDEFVLKFVKP